jgi:hypothetical protein
VPAQEGDLIGCDGLVLGAVADVEVVDARAGAELAKRARRAAAIAGPGLANRSASPTRTSQGRWSFSACRPRPWL